MGIQIKNRSPFNRFWGAVVFSLACVSLTLALSVWQFKRAGWKNQIIQTIQRNANLPPLALEPQHLTRNFIHANPYRSFVSVGKFDLSSHIFIGPKTNNGTSGYHLYALFYPEISPSAPIWMLCGWTENRHLLNNILNTHEQTLTFCLENPKAKGAFTPDNIPAKDQWYWPDPQAMSKHLGINAELIGKMIDSSAPLSPHLTANDVFNLPPNRHIEYAFTWMVLSVLLTLLGALFCIKQWKAIYV